MNLLISSNYNISAEKWSIVIKYNNIIKALTLERITRVKYFPSDIFFGFKTYHKLFSSGLIKLLLEFDLTNITLVYVINFPFKVDKYFNNVVINYYECREHHLLHAYSSLGASNFNKSTILIMDGAGYEKKYNKELCYSIQEYNNGIIKNLYIGEIDKSEIKLGVGFLYALHKTFFKIGEGSIRGLSSYGKSIIGKEIKLFSEDFF